MVSVLCKMPHKLTRNTPVFNQEGEILGDLIPLKAWTGEGFFIKLYRMNLGRAVKQRHLTPAEFYILGLLIFEMKDGNYSWLYPSDIIRTLALGRTTVYKALKALREKGYIQRERPGIYVVSDQIAWRGKRANDTVKVR